MKAMRFVRPLTVLLVLLIAASDAATSFAAPLYSLTDLGVLSGEESSFAEGINNTAL